MPHQCVKCNTFYEDASAKLLKGCSNCGGKFFFYLKKEDVERAKELTVSLSPEDREQIEKDVLDILGEEIEYDHPVFLDLESIRILRPGEYELDIVNLFKGKPLVYKLEDGKYVIDLLSTFNAKDKEIGDILDNNKEEENN